MSSAFASRIDNLPRGYSGQGKDSSNPGNVMSWVLLANASPPCVIAIETARKHCFESRGELHWLSMDLDN
jgi:hypothetical protein